MSTSCGCKRKLCTHGNCGCVRCGPRCACMGTCHKGNIPIAAPSQPILGGANPLHPQGFVCMPNSSYTLRGGTRPWGDFTIIELTPSIDAIVALHNQGKGAVRAADLLTIPATLVPLGHYHPIDDGGFRFLMGNLSAVHGPTGFCHPGVGHFVVVPRLVRDQPTAEELKRMILLDLADPRINPTRYTPPMQMKPPDALPAQQTPVFFPSQERTANRLANRMFDGILPHFSAEAAKAQFSELDIRVLVPPRSSLRLQTIDRLVDAFSRNEGLLGFLSATAQALTLEQLRTSLRTAFERRVLMLNVFSRRDNAQNHDQKAWEQFGAEVRENPRRLFLVVQDECHWGPGDDGLADRALNRFPPMLEPNVYVLHISATAWNMSRVLPEFQANVVPLETTEDYHGRDYYSRNRNNLCGIMDPPQVSTYWQFAAQFFSPGSISCSDIAIIQDYAKALLGRADATNLSRHAVTKIRMEQKMVVVRMKKSTKYAAAFALVLLEIRTATQDAFLVVSDTSDSPSEVIFNTYEDLGRLQHGCFFIVLEKARMGDTLPQSMAVFDIRARYQSKVLVFSKLLQDSGRVFGYRRDSPALFLTPRAARLLLDGDTRSSKPDNYMTATQEEQNVFDLPDAEQDQNWIFQAAYKPNEGTTHYHMFAEPIRQRKEAALRHSRSNRFILTAEPQVGKTGTLFALIKQLILLLGLREVITSNVPPPPGDQMQIATWAALSPQQFYELPLSTLRLFFDNFYKDLDEWDSDPFDLLLAQLRMKIDSRIDAAKDNDQNSLNLTVGDMGSGPFKRVEKSTALLCQEAAEQGFELRILTRSYDACGSPENGIIRANLADLPTKEPTFDYLVYSLSLWDCSFLEQARLVLKSRGYIFILQSSVDEEILMQKVGLIEDTDTIAARWSQLLKMYGFALKSCATTNHNNGTELLLFRIIVAQSDATLVPEERRRRWGVNMSPDFLPAPAEQFWTGTRNTQIYRFRKIGVQHDGNCGFYSLDTDRAGFVSVIRDVLAADPQNTRRLLGIELRSFVVYQDPGPLPAAITYYNGWGDARNALKEGDNGRPAFEEALQRLCAPNNCDAYFDDYYIRGNGYLVVIPNDCLLDAWARRKNVCVRVWEVDSLEARTCKFYAEFNPGATQILDILLQHPFMFDKLSLVQ
eukprot:TRINITY_DN3475_c0_g1_i1.p1 TRINITY_DN3475_c0_g1~~TRINITY_DN3475_c0_g1_i1.p1  ORF type:complete len:1153 (+),score=120.49 TRINITY_DN3475_c0_g1_i1:139-3597(+)